MQAISRLLPLLALAAAVSLAACKDESVPSTAPTTPDAPAEPVVVPPAAGDAPPPEPEGAAPVDPAGGATVTCTADTRKGGVCTREFSPVCGTFEDNTSKTFSNKCVACSDEKVVRYVAGPCPGDPAS
jgi:hypothetical protein